MIISPSEGSHDDYCWLYSNKTSKLLAHRAYLIKMHSVKITNKALWTYRRTTGIRWATRIKVYGYLKAKELRIAMAFRVLFKPPNHYACLLHNICQCLVSIGTHLPCTSLCKVAPRSKVLMFAQKGIEMLELKLSLGSLHTKFLFM